MTVLAPKGSRSVLAPALTPRPDFHVTRRLVGVSRWPLTLLTVIYMINVSDQFLLPATFPLLKREFGLSDTALGLLSGSYLLSVTVFTVPFGILADRYNRTRIIAWGTAAWGVTMIFTGLSTGFLMLLVGRMILGMWDPCDNPTSQSLLADYYPVNQRSKVMGIYQVGQLAGFALLPIAGIMSEAWGWRAAFFFFALPAFVVAALAWQLEEPPRGVQERKSQRLDDDGTREVESAYDEVGGLAAYKDLLRCRSYMAMLVSATVGSLFFGGIGVWTPTFLVRYHDLSIAEATSAITVVAVGGVVGVLASGQVADYLARSRRKSARLVVAGVSRVLAVPFFLFAFSIQYTTLMVISLMIGAMFLVAGIPPTNAARADVLHPNIRGRGTSLDAVSQSLAGAAAPVLFGIIADATDLRTAFFALIPLSGIAGLLLLTFGLASYGRDQQAVLDQVRAEHFASRGIDMSTIGGLTPDDAPDGIAGLVVPDHDVMRPLSDKEPLLQVEGIDFSYGPIQVLFGVDLTIPRGGCHAIVGRNGVGKTTLLANLGGLLDPQAGQMYYRGLSLNGVPPEQRTRLGITLMAAGRSMFPSLSVRDNLTFGAYPFTDADELALARVDAVLDVFPALQPRLDQRAGTLSGGEQQMVALGRALIAGPDLLLIDELSLGLAPTVTGELLDVVDQILEFGTTIVLVEQSIGVALEVADTVFFMDRGVVENLGDADALDAGELTRRLLEGAG